MCSSRFAPEFATLQGRHGNGFRFRDRIACDEGARAEVAETARRAPVLLLHAYHYFSSGVAFFQIPQRRRNLAQFVSSVDDRRHLSRPQ